MLNSMGYMYLERGQVEDSLTCFDASIALNPEFDKPRVNRANALAALSRFDEAIAQVDSLLASNPNSFTWLQNRCLLLDKAGRGMEALEACDKSLLHTPGSAVGHNNLAWILRGLGRVDEAVAAFRQAAKLDPAYSTPRENLEQLVEFGGWVEGLEAYLEEWAAQPGRPADKRRLAMYLMRHSSKPARLLQLAAELDAEPSADRPTPLMLHALAANGKRDALLEQVRLLRKRMGVEAFAPLASRQRSTTRRDARDQATQQGQYESDFDAVACYLEGVQADQLLRKTLPTAEQLKQLSERLGFDVTPALESARSVQMPTRYEDPIAHAVLANLMERVQSTPTAKSFASDRKVLIGTLDTSQPSAEVLVAPASRACMKPAVTTSAYDRRVVTVNWRLFSFAHEMAKDIIPTLGLFAGKGGVSLGIGEAAFARRMREEPELSQQFSSNIKDFLMIVKSGGRGDLPKGFPVALVNELRDGAELFVVAHEYAHILANHDIEAAAPTPERLTTLWKDELQADFLAVKMVADIAEQAKDEIIGATLLHYGSLFMMQGLHVLEQSEHLHKVGSPPLHTEAEIEDALRYSNDVLDAKPLKVEGLARQARTVSRHGNSPPLWLRKRLVQGYVEGEYASRFPNNEAMAALGRSFSIHMAFAYEAAIPDFKNGPSTSLLQEVVNQVHLEEP